MTPAERTVLLAAASQLELEACCIRESHTIGPKHDVWMFEDDCDLLARGTHDEMLETAQQLRIIAERQR